MTESSSTMVHVLTVIDGQTEELVDLAEIKNFSLDEFATQFDADLNSDPEMRQRYSVGPDDVSFLHSVFGYELHFDFVQYAYFIEAAKKN